jgi:hypothetical protein
MDRKLLVIGLVSSQFAFAGFFDGVSTTKVGGGEVITSVPSAIGGTKRPVAEEKSLETYLGDLDRNGEALRTVAKKLHSTESPDDALAEQVKKGYTEAEMLFGKISQALAVRASELTERVKQTSLTQDEKDQLKRLQDAARAEEIMAQADHRVGEFGVKEHGRAIHEQPSGELGTFMVQSLMREANHRDLTSVPTEKRLGVLDFLEKLGKKYGWEKKFPPLTNASMSLKQLRMAAGQALSQLHFAPPMAPPGIGPGDPVGFGGPGPGSFGPPPGGLGAGGFGGPGPGAFGMMPPSWEVLMVELSHKMTWEKYRDQVSPK